VTNIVGQADAGNLKVFLIVIFQNCDMLEKENFQFLYVSKAATQKKMVYEKSEIQRNWYIISVELHKNRNTLVIVRP